MDLAPGHLAKLRTAIHNAKLCVDHRTQETPPRASKGDQRATRVEAEDGRVRAAQADADDAPFPVIAGLNNRMWDNAVGMAMMTLKGEWGGNPFAAIEAIWAASEAVMEAAGPLPLASSEPWVESDEAYRKRIYGFAQVRPSGRIVGELLDACGEGLSLPRARLVPATTMQGEP